MPTDGGRSLHATAMGIVLAGASSGTGFHSVNPAPRFAKYLVSRILCVSHDAVAGHRTYRLDIATTL